MFSTDDFARYTQWSGIATLIFALITLVGFIFKWGIRFRLAGATGFLLVLTGGFFPLSLTPLTRTVIPGAIRYKLVFDNGSSKAVIATPPQITPSELDATLRQAASDLFSYGRLGTREENQLTVRARTIIHPEPGLSVPLYLGQIKRSLSTRDDNEMQIDIYKDNFAQLPTSDG
ncbi:Ycf51 family protein [Plectonema cf. radiosum LEGE 06105]|uniref:Ycf51 family protein n=1 Tax=Plectonema cf. radiosum LEGE 06105 TaxID=945769 RepID=A0A8J7JTP4_9CYAN|nr:Ycf51 family protein [Plectonema radiosum]MBE9212440.1 Ycf51 family protein [Plectonema cf. radiosum LEGE 06105]